MSVGDPILPHQTVQGQESLRLEFSIALGKLRLSMAEKNLSGELAVKVLRDALSDEERLLASARRNSRGYL